MALRNNNIFKYSGIGFQIVGTTCIGAFAGYWIDKKMGNTKPYFFALLGVLFLVLGMYVAFKDLLKRDKN